MAKGEKKHKGLQKGLTLTRATGRSASNSNGRACSSAPGKEDPYSFSHTQGVTGFDDALTDLQQRLRTLSAESQAPGDPRLQVQGDGKKSSAPQTGPHPDGHALRQPRAGRASSHLFRAQASAAVPVDAAQPQTGAVLPNAAVDGSTARAAPHASASMELLDKPPSPSAESPSTVGCRDGHDMLHSPCSACSFVFCVRACTDVLVLLGRGFVCESAGVITPWLEP